MKSLITVLIAILVLSGCETLGVVVNQASKVNDEALKTAEFTICNGASVGSIRRRFNTPELAEIWRQVCEEQQGFKP